MNPQGIRAAVSLRKEHRCRVWKGVRDWCYFSSHKSSAAPHHNTHTNRQRQLTLPITHSTHTRLSPIVRLLSVLYFDQLLCPPLSFNHRNIKINNTDKPSLHTCLFTGENQPIVYMVNGTRTVSICPKTVLFS